MNLPQIGQDYLPGLRIIKTSLAVLICLLIFFMFDYFNPVYAVISCVLMMRTSVDESFKAGIDRTVGTILGGVLAIITLTLMGFLQIDIESVPAAFFVSGAVLITLTISKIFKLSSNVGSMGAVVLLILMISYGHAEDQPLTYIMVRILETIIGIFIAVLVNRYFNPNFKWLK